MNGVPLCDEDSYNIKLYVRHVAASPWQYGFLVCLLVVVKAELSVTLICGELKVKGSQARATIFKGAFQSSRV